MAMASSSSGPHPPEPEPTVDDLTNWFLAAKRSLSSMTLCQQANVLVDTAKAAIQEASIISARCVFLRNSLQDQLNIALQVSKMVQMRQDQLRGEFQKILAELDSADSRLNATLAILRDSIVDPAFSGDGPSELASSQRDALPNGADHDHDYSSSSSTSRSASPKRPRNRTLHDFVDDAAIEDLKSRLRGSIDSVQESHDDLASIHSHFTTSLNGLATALSYLPSASTFQSKLVTHTPTLNLLEEKTEHMGTLLESLTNHFDRCQSALRELESHLPLSAPDILIVLRRDSNMVDDVVQELHDHFSIVDSTVQKTQDSHAELTKFLALAEDLVHQFDEFTISHLLMLPPTLVEFETQQMALATEMQARLDELIQLAEFYDGFVGAYDALVVEVARRMGVQHRMEKVAAEAIRRLETMEKDDHEERESFRRQWGMWLPVDIWPGLGDPLAGWDVKKREGGGQLPKLRKEVIERAVMKGNTTVGR